MKFQKNGKFTKKVVAKCEITDECDNLIGKKFENGGKIYTITDAIVIGGFFGEDTDETLDIAFLTKDRKGKIEKWEMSLPEAQNLVK